jgi:hypothetical protein
MASCPANVRETKIAFGKKPQTDLVTINLDTDLWSLTKTNTALMEVTLSTETDALDIGKGDEFATQVFKTSASTAVPLEKYSTSEFAAWLFCFGLGHATKTVAGTGFTYAAIPQDPSTQCIALPSFTYVEQIRTGANAVIDRAGLGMVVNDFTLAMASGPGRANCRLTANFIGTGQVANPSGKVIPALTPEHLLNANGTTVLTINGIDYHLSGDFNSLEFRWNNNVRTDSGYYPGSGTYNGFGIRGRMEFGTRETSLNFVARAEKGSPEFNNLLSLTEGTTTITIQGALIATTFYHTINLSFPRTILTSHVVGDDNGIVTVNCGVGILKPTDGVTPLCTLSSTTTTDAIFGL